MPVAGIVHTVDHAHQLCRKGREPLLDLALLVQLLTGAVASVSSWICSDAQHDADDDDDDGCTTTT